MPLKIPKPITRIFIHFSWLPTFHLVDSIPGQYSLLQFSHYYHSGMALLKLRYTWVATYKKLFWSYDYNADKHYTVKEKSILRIENLKI